MALRKTDIILLEKRRERKECGEEAPEGTGSSRDPIRGQLCKSHRECAGHLHIKGRGHAEKGCGGEEAGAARRKADGGEFPTQPEGGIGKSFMRGQGEKLGKAKREEAGAKGLRLVLGSTVGISVSKRKTPRRRLKEGRVAGDCDRGGKGWRMSICKKRD